MPMHQASGKAISEKATKVRDDVLQGLPRDRPAALR
jgi:hypothetical protein